jgi:hypothetical protein
MLAACSASTTSVPSGRPKSNATEALAAGAGRSMPFDVAAPLAGEAKAITATAPATMTAPAPAAMAERGA